MSVWRGVGMNRAPNGRSTVGFTKSILSFGTLYLLYQGDLSSPFARVTKTSADEMMFNEVMVDEVMR